MNKMQTGNCLESKSQLIIDVDLLWQTHTNDYTNTVKSAGILYEQAKKVLTQSEQIPLLHLISLCYTRLGKYGEALGYSELAIMYLKKTDNRDSETGSILKIHSEILNSLNRADEALVFIKKAIKIYQQLVDKTNELNAMILMGQSYIHLNLNNNAIVTLLKAQLMAENQHDKVNLGRIFLNLGNAHSEIRDWDKASEYYLSTSKLALKLGKTSMYAGAINNLCLIYSIQEQHEKALELSLQALEILERDNNVCDIPKLLSNIGMMYVKQGDFPEALNILNRAIQILSKADNPGLFIRILLNIAMCYHLSDNQDNALEYLAQAQELSEEIKDPDMQCAAYELSFMIANGLGQNEKALEYHNKMLRAMQEVWSKDKEANLIKVENEFELIRNKHQAQIYKLKNVELKKKNKQVSEQKAKLESTLSALNLANQTKNKLFSIISHDLRGPLGSLYQGLELLSDPEFTLDTKEDFLSELTNAAHRAYNLTDNLLYWASHQMEVISNHPAPVYLESLVSEVVDNHSSIAKAKHIQIIQNIIAPEPAWVDANILSIILRNLLSNALKFTPQGGEINIDIQRQEKEYVCLVSDTGSGITKDVLDKLFEPDRNFVTQGTNSERGIGLGLLLCKEFTGIMGSRIVVESKPGKGTTFIFNIPVKSNII